MKKLIVMLVLFFAGFCLFDSVIGPSRFGLAYDALGFFGSVIAFFILAWLSGEITMATNPREVYEKGLLFDKVKYELEQAIKSNRNVVKIIVNKVYHPNAGVYYNVHAE